MVKGTRVLRIDKLILTGIMAGIYSVNKDGFEQNYGLNHHPRAFTLTFLTILTGYLLHKIDHNEKKPNFLILILRNWAF